MSSEFEYTLTSLLPFTKTHIQLVAHPLRRSLEFKAGQYLEILYPNHQYLPFSIANCPQEDSRIELHLRVAENDKPLQSFLDITRKTKRFVVRGPFGHCFYKKDTPCDLILVAAGTGIAPAKAILEELCQHHPEKVCHLYWSAKYQRDFYFPGAPHLWQKKLKNFHYQSICTQEPLSESPRILEAVIQDIKDLSTSQAYIFGPSALAADALNLFIQHGLKRENFFTDVL